LPYQHRQNEGRRDKNQGVDRVGVRVGNLGMLPGNGIKSDVSLSTKAKGDLNLVHRNNNLKLLKKVF